jgi:DNA-directed RNA polymerase subunit alpha
MIAITPVETYSDNSNSLHGVFLIEPLVLGQAVTLGNALRRTLLSDLSGIGITGVRINNSTHEFSSIEGIREDILEIILNLKEIVWNTPFLGKKNIKQKFQGFLNIKGPSVVTAGLISLPKTNLKILNPNQYICTIVSNVNLYIEIDLEFGTGYKFSNSLKFEKLKFKRSQTLNFDTCFSPVTKVNYKIKLIHDTYGNIKESLIFEIVTNGSITPKRSFQEALKLLVNLFSSLFFTKDFLQLSTHWKNYLKS